MSGIEGTRSDFNLFESPNAQAQEQEVKNCIEFLKIEYKKYRQYKIIMKGLQECVEDENYLEINLRNKIQNIVLDGELSQIRLTTNLIDRFETVLGVPLNSSELKHSESHMLLKCLQSKLSNKYLNIQCNQVSPLITDEDIENTEAEGSLEISTKDLELLELKNRLLFEQENYIKNQLELLEIYEELKNIRLETVPMTTNQKIEEYSLKSKINYLKSQLAKEKCRVDIFMETSHSLKAYIEIINDIKQSEEELKQEINKLKNRKKEYAQVSCSEYEEILKSYLQYKLSFQKKKMMYELYN